jgi:hypothetical protein
MRKRKAVIEAGFRRRMRLTLSAVVTRMKQIAQGIGRELRGGFSLTADPRSFARLPQTCSFCPWPDWCRFRTATASAGSAYAEASSSTIA